VNLYHQRSRSYTGGTSTSRIADTPGPAWFGILPVSLYCLHAWHAISKDIDTLSPQRPPINYMDEDQDVTTDDKEGILLAL
jgi:hypothetical protein